MNSVPILARLFLRPYVLWSAFTTYGLTVLCWYIAFVARGGVRQHAGAPEAQILYTAELKLALGTVLFPMAVAAWIAWSLYELLLCSFAATVPGLRRRLFVLLLVLGVTGAACTAWWCDENPGSQSLPVFFALAFLCFALGILWSDPVFAGWGAVRWILQTLALVPIFLAPELVRWFERAPAVLVPLALLAGAGLLWLPFRRSAVRARSSDPAHFDRPLTQDQRSRATWRTGRTLSGTTDWTRAALHEAFGQQRGGWLGAALVHALIFSTILVVLLFMAGLHESRDARAAAGCVYSGLVGGVPGVASRLLRGLTTAALPIWTSFFLMHTFTLGGAGVCPVARARRAEVAWRTSAIATSSIVLAMALVLAVYSELAFRFAGLSRRSDDVPAFLHALASAGIAAPAVHWVCLRWLADRSKQLTTHYAGLLGLAMLVLGLPGIALSLLWNEVFSDWPVPAWFAWCAVMVCASQAVWRRELARHHVRTDLTV